MFDIKDPFSTFKDGKLNGATAMIMQEDEDFQNADYALKIYVKSYGLLENEDAVKYLLSILKLRFEDLSPGHQRQLIDKYTR